MHELLYGFVPAIVTGFILTAIPNWTGQLPLQGTPLLILVLVWAAGSTVVGFAAHLNATVVAIIDSSFLILVIGAALREILAGRNWRNLLTLLPIGVLAAENILFHMEVASRGGADISIRIGAAAIVLLMSLVGGRVIPSFTHNWLVRENPGRLPVSFGRYDARPFCMRPIFCPARVLPHRTVVIRICPRERRASRMDGGRRRHDDPRGHDLGEPRPYRQGFGRFPMDTGNLRGGPGSGFVAYGGCPIFGMDGSAPGGSGSRMDFRVRRLRRCLCSNLMWSAPEESFGMIEPGLLAESKHHGRLPKRNDV